MTDNNGIVKARNPSALAEQERNGVWFGKAINFHEAEQKYGSVEAAIAAGCIPMQEIAGLWLPGEISKAL